MNNYLGVYSKKRAIGPELDSRIRRLARETFFDWLEPTISSEYSYTQRCALYLFSNHGEELDSVRQEILSDNKPNKVTLAYTGTAFSGLEYLLAHPESLNKKRVARLNGVFSLCLLDKENDSFRAYNNHMRLENIFFAENNDYIFIGTRALLLHMLVSNSKRPEIDESQICSFLYKGYFPSKGTPFLGVTETPIYSELTVENGKINISSIDDCKESFFTIDPDEAYYDMLTQTLLNATKIFKGKNSSVELGLTGGRDSRMIFLSLLKNGFDIKLKTSGYADSPDVIVSKQIAEMYGIEHITMEPKKSNKGVIDVDLLGSVQKTIFAADGMIYGWESCAENYGQKYQHSKLSMHGLGGEILRGGYARSIKEYKPDKIQATVNKLFRPLSNYFIPGADSLYQTTFNDLLGGYDPGSLEAMEYMYVNERMGKWASTSMRCRSINHEIGMPLCDEQLVKKALMLKSMPKVKEKVIYEVIRRLDDRLLDVPFAQVRWAFESDGPIDGDVDGWKRRTPVMPTSQRSAFNWKKTCFKDMRKVMAAVIFDRRSTKIFSILDKNKIHNLFYKNEFDKDNGALNVFAWRIYTACVLLEGSWYTNHSGKGGGYLFNSHARKSAHISIPSES
ncbi:hypothetical protein [Paenibacillus lautus]|uniref:hypothetical protein n=1 Tax=Paenibacillus lautus TaxID=1401 RepID=UPI001C7DCCCD|nr:hypothetical protein [Paenibacillus lautus]MBX4152345.1 hypothetical protein [Paenibacillus lautus]